MQYVIRYECNYDTAPYSPPQGTENGMRIKQGGIKEGRHERTGSGIGSWDAAEVGAQALTRFFSQRVGLRFYVSVFLD